MRMCNENAGLHYVHNRHYMYCGTKVDSEPYGSFETAAARDHAMSVLKSKPYAGMNVYTRYHKMQLDVQKRKIYSNVVC